MADVEAESSTTELKLPAASRLATIAPLLPLLAILVAVALLYVPTLGDSFHGDDYVAFTEYRTTSFWTFAEDALLFQDFNFYWRPLGKIFQRALYEAAGLDALVFRAAGLGIFLTTLVCLYAFCRREGLGYVVALGAALIFGLLPNHVVSVAWVTNTSRLMSLLFLLLCLLALQSPNRHALLREGLAGLCFVAACLSDETMLALAPVPLLYATFLHDPGLRWKPALLRATAYGAFAVALIPTQLSHTLDDEPRLAHYGLGEHVVTESWALASQLVLPLTRPAPMEVLLRDIEPLQWAAGLVAIVAGLVLLALGTRLQRFLVLWAAASLAPFALWDALYTSPRYVYVAAAPFAVLASDLVYQACYQVTAALHQLAPKRRHLQLVSAGVVAFIALAAGVISAQTLLQRNEIWSHEAARYGVFAEALQRDLPSAPAGAQIYVVADGLAESWATAAARTIYADPNVRVRPVRASRLEQPFRRSDLVFYMVGEKLVPIVFSSQAR